MRTVLDKKNIRIVLWILLGILTISFFVPVLSIDYDKNLPSIVKECIELEEDNASAFELLISMFKIESIKEFLSLDIEKTGSHIIMVIEISYAFLFINIILFIRKNWNKTCFTILHFLSFFFIQCPHLLNYRYEVELKKRVNDEMGVWQELFGGITDNMISEIIQFLRGMLSYGYWIFTICGILVFIVLILDSKIVRRLFGITTEGENSVSGSPDGFDGIIPNYNPRLQVLSGKYENAIIKMQNEETIVIGRDPNCCHLVLGAPGVSGEHCRIRYIASEGIFYVLDCSLNGTYIVLEDGINSIPLTNGKEERVHAGTIIMIGKGGDRMKLLA